MKVKTFLGAAVVAMSIVSCSGEEPKTVEKTIEVKEVDGGNEVTVTTTTSETPKSETTTKVVTKKTTKEPLIKTDEIKSASGEIKEQTGTKRNKEIKTITTQAIKDTVKTITTSTGRSKN